MNSSLCVCNSGGICTKWLEVAVFVRVLPWWSLVPLFSRLYILGMTVRREDPCVLESTISCTICTDSYEF